MKNLSLKENISNLLSLFIISILLITIIGYFDEGHQNIYNGFWNYLEQGGYPPVNDYLMWTIFFCICGIVIFNLVSLGFKQKTFQFRFALSIIFSPLFLLCSLIVIGITLSF